MNFRSGPPFGGQILEADPILCAVSWGNKGYLVDNNFSGLWGRHFFYNDKSQNNKKASIHFKMWKVFDIWCGVNSIKTNLQTWNLWTGQYVSYKSLNQFWLNLPHENGKTIFTSKTFPIANGYILQVYYKCSYSREGVHDFREFCKYG